jgi:DNA primase large subunit
VVFPISGSVVPVSTSDMGKYPFLPQARQHIAPLGFDIKDLAELPRVSNRAKERVRTSFDLELHLALEPSKDFETEIASFPLAVFYVGGSGENRLIERFALHEAWQINRYLDSELNADIIMEIAKAFGWDFHFKRETQARCTYSLHFAKYLQMGSKGRLFHDPKWKLVNRQLEGGQVYLTQHDFRRLLQEEVKKYIEDRARQELGKIEPDIQKDIDELKAEFVKKRPQLAEFDLKVYAKEPEYPPCISELLERASKAQHLSHIERFTLVTYLLHQGVSVDSVVSMFSGVADFNEDKTRYQVEHLAGKTGGRTPYVTCNCATLQTHGVCSKPTDPICRTIKNPLTYHLRRQGRSEIPAKERTQSGQTRKRMRSKNS